MKRTLSLLIATILTTISAYAWKPLFAGHRGSYKGVENTAEAYRNGADVYGYTGLECDVRVTKDGQYVICHEETTGSFCSTNLNIASATLAQLKALTFTQKRGGVTYTGKICTVAEYLDICNEKNCFPIIELKYTTGINYNSMVNFPGLWNLVKSKGLEKKAIFLTSMENSLIYIKTNYPEANCQYLMYTDSDSRFAVCKKYGIDASIAVSGITQAVVNRYRNAGLNVAAWTVNSEANYKTYGNMGVYMMTCDYLYPSNMPQLTSNEPDFPGLEEEEEVVPPFAQSYNLRQRYIDFDIPELAGKSVRRMIQGLYYTYILAVDANRKPTVLVYHADSRKVLTVLSTVGMEGTEFNCSDIQVTADGILLACNKELTQCDAEHVEATDKRRGIFRIYRWENDQWGIPTGNPIPWLQSQETGFWYRSYTGDTFAWTGTLNDGMAVVSCETTGGSRGLRMQVIPVSGGVMGAESYHIPYYLGNSPTVTQLGDGYRFLTSPLNAANYFIIGGGDTPILECAFKHTNKTEVVAKMNTALAVNGLWNGGTLSHGDHTLLALPQVSGNTTSGVTLLDLSYGLKHTEASKLSGNAIASAYSASFAAGGRTFYKSNTSTGAYGSYMDLFLLRDGKFSYFTTSPDTVDPVPVMVEKWNLSDAKGNYTSSGWDATQVRNMDFFQGKLYLVYQQQNIKVVNAQTCADLGNLNKGGVFGGTVKLADVKICDGKVVASNIALAANNDSFRLYRWDNDQSHPQVILDTRDFGGAVRVGDCIGWQGTWQSGAFYFCSDDGITTRLLRYDVNNGVVSPNPVVTYLTTDGSTQLKVNLSTRVIPEADGYWIDGRQNPTTFVTKNGVKSLSVNFDSAWGNDLHTFTYQNSTFALTTAYSGDNDWNSTGGRMRMVCVDRGWEQTYVVADYPANGFSTTRTNGNGTSGISTYVHDNTIEAWVLITNQGIGYYVNREGSPATFSPQPITQQKGRVIPSRGSVNISGKKSTPASDVLSFSGLNLCDDIHLTLSGADASSFALSETSIPFGAEARTVTVTLLSDRVGDYEARIEVSSENCDPTYIVLTAQVTEAQEFNDRIVNVNDRWLFSQTEGNLGKVAGWFGRGDRPTIDICVANHRYYALNSAPGCTNPMLSVVGAYTGVLTGSMDLRGVSGGENPASSLAELGGYLLLSNSARAAGVDGATQTDPLKIYIWKDFNVPPTLWMEDPNHEGLHINGNMTVWGDQTRGKVMFTDGAKVLTYNVTDGRISSTPEVVSLKRNGTVCRLGNVASVSRMDDGSLWVFGSENRPAHFTASGEFIEELYPYSLKGNECGNSGLLFTLGDKPYMAASTYLSNQSGNFSTGALAFIDYSSGVSEAVTLSAFPEKGLGSTANSSKRTRTVMEKSTDGERINLWLLVAEQGVSFFNFDATDAGLTVDRLTLRCDVDLNGKLTISDAQEVINVMLGVYDSEFETDVDLSGTTDITDAQCVINALLQ